MCINSGTSKRDEFLTTMGDLTCPSVRSSNDMVSRWGMCFSKIFERSFVTRGT